MAFEFDPDMIASIKKMADTLSTSNVDPSAIKNFKLNAEQGSNNKKLIIGNIFEPQGALKDREDGTFTYPFGETDGKDPLRQVMGKYWTYSDDGKHVIFLNPFLGDQSSTTTTAGSHQMPIKVHFDKPNLVEGEIWPEYEQTMIITPNLQWIYENFAMPFFDKQVEQHKDDILQMLENGTIEDFLYGNEDNPNLPFDKGIVGKLQEVIRQWWFSVMQIPGADTKGCSALAQTIGLSPEAGLEICQPFIKLNSPFLDHVLDVELPVEQKFNLQYQPILNTKFPYYSLNSEYNFYIKIYEQILEQFKNKAVPNPLRENMLPNIYPFISSFVPQSLTGEKSDYLKYKNLITLGGIVKDYSPEALRITSRDILSDNNLKKAPASSKQYFSTWSHSLGRALTRGAQKTFDTIEPVGKKYNVILFPMYHTEILQNYNDDKFMFPMYNELVFSTGVQNVLGDTMRASRLANNFMNFYSIFADPFIKSDEAAASLDTSAYTKDISFAHVTDKLDVTMARGDLEPTIKIDRTIDPEQTITVTELETFLATLNLTEMFQPEGGQISNLNLSSELFEKAKEMSKSEEIQDLFRSNSTFITVDENDDYNYTKPGFDMQKMLLSVIFVGKLRKMAKRKLRTYTDILQGKINYSETVMYVVTKSAPSFTTQGLAGATSNINPLQTYYFLNTSKADVLKFIDTQVNYDVMYRYDIEAIVLSLGSNYIYKEPQKLVDITAEFVEKLRINGVQIENQPLNFSTIDTYTKNLQKGEIPEGTETVLEHHEPSGGGARIHVTGQPGAGPSGNSAFNKIGEIASALLSEEDTDSRKNKKKNKKKKPTKGNPKSGRDDGLSPIITDALLSALKTVSSGGGNGDPNGVDTADITDFTDVLSKFINGSTISLDDIFDPEAEFDNLFMGIPKIINGKNIGANSLSVRVKVRKKPSYKLLRVHLATTFGRVLDKPPVFPDVLITPYKGVNNKLLINLNQNVGEYFMKPIFFDANDEEQYEKQTDAQKIFVANKSHTPAIEYKSDDQIGKDGHFEVYRLDRKPQSYKDFQGRLKTTIRGFHEMEVGHMETDSVSLHDDILPNRKYYYTFRAVDVHGNKSNPTPVFEVEMVDDNGTVYMLQKIIEMKPPNIKDISKDAKKYIQIKPTFEQSILTAEGESAFDLDAQKSISLGALPVGLWGKKFKIRITSKSSGKQIDLNVTFKRSDKNILEKGMINKILNTPDIIKN